NAQEESGFRYLEETGEERYSSFLGVPIQRLGQMLGVLVVQSTEAEAFASDVVNTLAVVATVIAEMRETGIITGEGQALSRMHTQPVTYDAVIAHEGLAEGRVLRHEPRVVITNPVAENPGVELQRLDDAIRTLRGTVDDLLDGPTAASIHEQREILETYRMFANSAGWVRRMEGNIRTGLSAEAAVEMEQTEARSRMEKSSDPYLRDRLHDLDDLFNRLLRIITGKSQPADKDIPDNPILVARNIGPAELLEYGRGLKGIILEEGSIGSHATIIARSMAIPLLIHVDDITTEALDGDPICLDAERGSVHLRPDDLITAAIRNRIEMAADLEAVYTQIRDKPAITRDGIRIGLSINAGLLDDLPNLERSGGEGVGLFRTELRFLAANSIPSRSELSEQYSRVLDSAKGRRVVFRTLDIGSDKVLPYLKRDEEPNPALGWRALRISLDKPGLLRMQIQSLIRGANGRPFAIMFPLVADLMEFVKARDLAIATIQRERKSGHEISEAVEIGAMLETPSLAFAPDRFFTLTDFVSIGGNDLKQFFFAADRQNERIRYRYHSLYTSYLAFIKTIADRCHTHGTCVSYCGEDAGVPAVAVSLAAMGVHNFSLRSSSIGRVKYALLHVSLAEIASLVSNATRAGQTTVDRQIRAFLKQSEADV
ncbi:MAG: phosphoenolpyruvate--protein phosphotransferase, partial [Rhodobacteraceae bacterium]|nr:phosphoenolpyruvate--protein phosphotransferase [Paracoccaceae bacterium]